MTFAADSVSATPFRGGFAPLNPPLGHSKAREKEKFLIVLFFTEKYNKKSHFCVFHPPKITTITNLKKFSLIFFIFTNLFARIPVLMSSA